MQIVPLKGVEDWGEAAIHTAALKDPTPEQLEMTWRKLQPKGYPKSELLAEGKAAHIGADFLSGPVAL